MTAIVIIPARYNSTRFPGKPLVSLKGKPLIQHTYDNSKASRLASDVIVATDSRKIFDEVTAFGGKAVMTGEGHVSGTDRIAEVARVLEYDIIVNVQGDEPLIRPEMIDDAIGLLDDRRASVGTLARRIETADDILDPNVVKVVFNKEGFAFYFSRAPIPYDRDKWKSLKELASGCKLQVASEGNNLINKSCGLQAAARNCWFKHIGIYSYRKEVLLRLSQTEPSRLEQTEKLEQLRALEEGMMIKVGETVHDTIGVDIPEDLEKVEKCLSSFL